jgi:exodeoxyribonuclease V alpha subunit
VVLDRVHRYEESGVIAVFADAVRRGDADGALELLAGDHEGLGWVRDRDATGFGPLWERLVEQRSRLVEMAAAPGSDEATLAQLSEIAVLCAHREGPGSVALWRRDIEAALDERFPGLRYGGEWYPGRPVMITRNDYTMGLYTGDIGIAVQTTDGLRVVFDRGGIRSFPPGSLGEHTTVHAMTIHKSQGSQFTEVFVSLPADSSRLLTRELLYTAVTRASTSVTVVGDEPAIRRAVERSVQRASGLRARLWV